MIVRQTEAEDCAALAGFARWTYTKAFGGSFSPGDLEHHLRDKLSDAYFRAAMREDVFLIAENESRLIAFVQFGTARGERAAANYCELRRLYVHPEFQNRGIGSRLLDAALAHPHLEAASAVFIEVWEHNHGARALYERYGFAIIGSRKFAVASGAPTSSDLIMVRRKPPARG